MWEDAPFKEIQRSLEMDLMDELEKFVDSISDPKLREKVKELLYEPDISIESSMLPLEETPAGAYMHHAYVGGLLEHTVAVTRLAITLCDLVEEVYGGEVNRDLVLAGALLHDVMKCHVYTPSEHGGYASSPLGDRIDHLSLLVAEMYKRGFPVDLIHVAASHHGDQSPVRPKTLEALIVSIADLADSEMSRRLLRAAEYLLRQATGEKARFTSSRKALEVVRTKTLEGWDGVRRLARES